MHIHHQFHHYDVITLLEQHSNHSTYLVSTHGQPKAKAILKLFLKPTLLSLPGREMFFQEIKMLTRIRHPHIVPIIDGGIEKGSTYIVSAYMPGGSLRALLDQTFPQRLPFEEAIEIISQIGQALTYLHKQWLVHGHLKPEHIFFDVLEKAFLSDIYIPKQTTGIEQEASCHNLPYSAPEQCEEETQARACTALSDQYALCCIAYELLTGQPPFTTRDIIELKKQLSDRKPTPLTTSVPELPESVNKAILKGLEKDPLQRYPTVAALLADLHQASQTDALDAIPVITASQTTRFIPPDPLKKSDTAVLAHFATDDISSFGLIKQSAQLILSMLWHSSSTARHSLSATISTRPKRVWLGASLLILICCLIIYTLLVIHGNPHTHTVTPPAGVAAKRVRSTATPVSFSTSIIRIHVLPTAAATPRPTPSTIPPSPMPRPIPTATAITSTLLFSGVLSSQTKQGEMFSTNLIPALTIDNVRIEADITSSGYGGGITFRSKRDGSMGYRFFIETNGSYALLTSTQIIAYAFSSAIKTGNNSFNHVSIVVVGSKISIAINAHNIINISDRSYSFGHIGVMNINSQYSTITTCKFTIYPASQ